MTSTHLKGLIAAPFTAFHPDGTLHVEMIDRQAHSLAANGIVGAFVCGTTGEGLSLTTEERMQVAERWMAAAPASLRIIVHVGHHAIGDCQRLARHAAEIGAAAFGTLAPSFFKAASVSDLVDFCSGVASSAPELPFYYYHIPAMTGVSLPCVDFLTAAGGRIPNLAGLKFTFENLMDYLACVQLEGGRYDVIYGRDEMLLAGLALGTQAAIGSTYNFAAPIYQRILESYHRADLGTARSAQGRANGMIAAMVRHGGLAAGKAIMALIGLDCGPVRSPLRALSGAQIDSLRKELDACGFDELKSEV